MSKAVTETFMHALQNGCLSPLVERIRNDDTLMLALRGDYINIYYRGGSLLKIDEKKGHFAASFDKNYAKNNEVIPKLDPVGSLDDCAAWLGSLPALKEIMNTHFAQKRRSEREFQQLVAWENNRSTIASDTEYFITDIEYADVDQSAKLDMLGLKWLSKDRKNDTACKPVLVEMKYGINAYDGDAGIVKHINDLRAILSTPERCAQIGKTIDDQFEQLLKLDLVKFNRSSSYKRATVSGRPEVVFLLANHNPRSKKLLNILNTVDEPTEFDLRFFVSTFAGYGMHDDCMLPLNDFKELLTRLAKLAPPTAAKDSS